MATYTATAAQTAYQPRAIHAGANTALGIQSNAASLSVGDIILGVKVPHGAVINYGAVWYDASLGKDVGVAVGDGGNNSRFLKTANLSTSAVTLPFNHNIGYKYDFSDLDASQYDTIDVFIRVASAVSAIAGDVRLMVIYNLDEPKGGD
jgi:hypothetical protein